MNLACSLYNPGHSSTTVSLTTLSWEIYAGLSFAMHTSISNFITSFHTDEAYG